MVNYRLVCFIEKNYLLSNFQCCFRTGRSTNDHLASLESEIQTAFSRREFLLAIFFDLQRAYDTEWRFRVIAILQEWGLDRNILAFIEGFLGRRRFRVRVGTTFSIEKVMKNGLPQGSVLSITLFAIAINHITRNVNFSTSFRR